MEEALASRQYRRVNMVWLIVEIEVEVDITHLNAQRTDSEDSHRLPRFLPYIHSVLKIGHEDLVHNQFRIRLGLITPALFGDNSLLDQRLPDLYIELFRQDSGKIGGNVLRCRFDGRK
jgi:hypothetical protein